MNYLKTLASGMIVLAMVSCKTPVAKDLAKEQLIPKPVELTATGSSFELTAKTKIYVQSNSSEIKKVGEYLSQLFAPATGFAMDVNSTEKAPGSGIYLEISSQELGVGDEGYLLDITSKGIILKAQKPAGLLMGIQTIRQLLPASIEASTKQVGPWLIASGTIKDYPKYGYRGAMLDVCRHFFPVKDVKRYIDLLAMYKMNVMHLHLTDDQGWRIEIKSWPNLTVHGASTQVGGGEGGFYTQEQYKDIVNYAQERYITIIPEIDMPGHTNAALASYAELNCDGKARKLYTGTHVGFSTLCVNKKITYKFVDDVIGELAAITPGKYIHIGGDESHSTKKKDYIKFINKVQEIVASHGKVMMGWADVASAKLKPNTLAQFWQTKPKNAKAAVKQGVKIVMSPAAYIYLDMQYDSICPLGLHWAGYANVQKAYSWMPDTLVKGIEFKDIAGVEAPLWTETVKTMDDIEFMVMPRLAGCAELGWSPEGGKNWDDYKVRLGAQKNRFEVMDINYFQSKLVPWSNEVSTIIEKK